MSFTLMRYKDGKPTPIKLSIWDAFKGAPPLKPRPHKCLQCGQFHKASPKKDTTASSKPCQETPKNKTEGIAATEQTPKDKATANEHNFTAKEDAQILELKAKETSWADIAKALGNERSKGMVQTRFKQLKAAEDTTKPNPEAKKAGQETSNTPSKPFEQMTKAEKKAAKAQEHREAGLKKQAEADAKKDEPEKVADTSASTQGQSQSKKSQPVVNSPAAATTTMDDKQIWIRAASKHFDRTGHRITPEQARKMAQDAS